MLKKSKYIKTTLKLFEWLIFVSLLFFSLLIISPILPIKNAPRTHVIITGSMEPTIKAGSISITHPVDPTTIKSGDIIAFTSPSDPKDTILHRVDSISGTDPLTFKTKGDNNNNVDDWDVMASGVLGTHLLSIPYLGYAGLFVKKPLGFGLIIGLPALVFAVLQILNIKKGITEQVEAEIAKRQKKSSKKVAVSLLAFGLSLTVTSFIVTKALFSHVVKVSGLTISVADFVPPPVPTLLSPANNSYRNTAGLVMDWTDVSDYLDQHNPVYYIYQSSHDPLFGTLTYQSGHLALSQIPAPGTPEGIYYWRVKACDSINNCSDWTLPWKVTVDNTPPVVTINSPTQDQYILANTPINITVTDANLSHYWLVMQNSSGINVAGPGTVTQHTSIINQDVYTWNIASLPEGDYTIKLEARDLAGNKLPNLAPVPFDPESPTDSVDWITVHINNPPSTPTGLTILNNTGLDIGCSGYVTNRLITVDWNDNPETDLAYYNYDIKDQNNFAHPTASQYTGQIRDLDGVYRYRVSAVDTSGLESSETNWCYVTLDRIAPITNISNQDNVDSTQVYTAISNNISIDFSITDANPDYTKLYYSLDLGATWTETGSSTEAPTGSFNFDLDSVAADSGIICFDTVGYDKAGNIETSVLAPVINPLSTSTYCLMFDKSQFVSLVSPVGSVPSFLAMPAPIKDNLPDITATFNQDTNIISLSFINLPSDAPDKYELIYLSDGLEKGLESSLSDTDHYLGSCSAGGICTPDPFDGKLIVIIGDLTKEIDL